MALLQTNIHHALYWTAPSIQTQELAAWYSKKKLKRVYKQLLSSTNKCTSPQVSEELSSAPLEFSITKSSTICALTKSECHVQRDCKLSSTSFMIFHDSTISCTRNGLLTPKQPFSNPVRIVWACPNALTAKNGCSVRSTKSCTLYPIYTFVFHSSSSSDRTKSL